MRKLIVVLMAFGFAAAAFADPYTWTGAAGDCLWETRENWDPLPPSNWPVSAGVVFPAGNWTIRKDSDSYYYSITLQEGAGTITLVGNGKLQAATDATLDIPKGRELCFDGPTLNFPTNISLAGGAMRIKSGLFKAHPGGLTFGDAGRLIVEGGRFTSDSTVIFTNNVEMVVCGGTASCSTYWKVYGPDTPEESGSRIRLVSGSFIYDRTYTAMVVKNGASFENLGGTVVWGKVSSDASRQTRLSTGTGSYGQGDAFKDFLPPVGGKLILIDGMGSGGSLRFAEKDAYDVGGTIFATNSTAGHEGSVLFDSASVTLRGGASVCAHSLRLNGGKTIDLDLSSVKLGAGGYIGNDSTPLKYRDGITFGAWADWSEENATNVGTTVEGPLVFDTKDCFDGETPRSISLRKVDLSAATELVARGGGSAIVTNVTFKDEFRTLEVADGTTLELTGSAPQLKTMNLRIGANAILKVDLLNGGYVDAAAVAEFGTGSKIVVTALPATLTEKTLYPIYFAPAGTTPDLTKIEFAAGVLPDGWILANTANNVYLTDGKTEPYAAIAKRFWTGGGSDNLYSNADNWYDGNVSGSGAEAYLYGVHNTAIDIDSALTLREFCIGASAGPFVFDGSAVKFQYPGDSKIDSNQASVRNDGKFAVVVANSVDSANCYRFISIGEGSVSMTGGSQGTGASIPLNFGGDVRLGGTWNVAWMRAQAKNYSNSMTTKTAARTSRLTVMPGAVLTVAEQACDVNEAYSGALAIAKNGTATISGSNLTFSKDNTHYVDGTLAVNCPLVTPARQTFRGDGTLKLLGGVAASETGSVRVEGDLTLVPSNWVNAVTLSVKDNVTLAPEAAWTFGDDGVLEVVNHSTLTLAAGGHRISLAKPIVTEGTVALKGAGKYEIAAAGMKIRKVTCANGAAISVADGFGSKDGFTDVLTVREPDDSIAFDEGLKIKMRYDPLTDETTYSAKRKAGLVLIVR